MEGKIHVETWIEEGWNDEKECATDEYNFNCKVIVKDYQGNTLSEDVGSIYQAADGRMAYGGLHENRSKHCM